MRTFNHWVLFLNLNRDRLVLVFDSDYYGLGYLVRGIATEVRRVGRRVDCLACLYDLCPDAFNLERLLDRCKSQCSHWVREDKSGDSLG